MDEYILYLLFFLGWLSASLWMVRKAFREKKEDEIAKKRSERIKGIRWGFAYQLLLGMLSLGISVTGIGAAIYLMVRGSIH